MLAYDAVISTVYANWQMHFIKAAGPYRCTRATVGRDPGLFSPSRCCGNRKSAFTYLPYLNLENLPTLYLSNTDRSEQNAPAVWATYRSSDHKVVGRNGRKIGLQLSQYTIGCVRALPTTLARGTGRASEVCSSSLPRRKLGIYSGSLTMRRWLIKKTMVS